MSHRLTITLPDHVYEQIVDRANRDYRSISQEIIYLLEKFTPLSQQPTQQPPIQPTLSYPPGVRSPENPAGRPDIITARVKSLHQPIHRVLQRPQYAVHSKT